MNHFVAMCVHREVSSHLTSDGARRFLPGEPCLGFQRSGEQYEVKCTRSLPALLAAVQ